MSRRANGLSADAYTPLIDLAPELADMHVECAQILKLSGQPALAEAHLERARRLLALRPIP